MALSFAQGIGEELEATLLGADVLTRVLQECAPGVGHRDAWRDLLLQECSFEEDESSPSYRFSRLEPEDSEPNAPISVLSVGGDSAVIRQ